MDLLYWEHRLSVWGSIGATYKEAVIEQIPPMNSREFMEHSLLINKKHRLPPYNLTQKIISINEPSLLQWKFNDDKKTSLLYFFPRLRYIKKGLTKLYRLYEKTVQ